MDSFLPITLAGHDLGQRHRYLNSLVREASSVSGSSFHDIEALPEYSPVDRLFKIDLATKKKNVEYIIRNLKDDDMLYVSRALKSTWLLDHRDIINPKYLEDDLYPEMITPAVSKMKYWLYVNLRDPAACQEFYLYYKEGTFQFAIKFLSHCSQEFILDEAPKILTKLSPHYLKVLSEKCPKVAKIYFDSLATDEDVRTQYLKQEESYYNSVKCVLKSDADVFLDITEKYFNVNSFSRFSPSATNYIIRCQKSRFTNKLELYVVYLLHIPTLAEQLSVDECQEAVIKLARANYLQQWFQYKVVEPLIKRLSPDKRAAFKKRVFVEKDVGDYVDEWPYGTPEPPLPSTDSGLHVFDDKNYSPVCGIRKVLKRIQKKKGKGYCLIESCTPDASMKSELDRLFDEFRFVGFERTLYDLRKRIGAASTPERRRDMFLVLVSKSGGRSDAVAALLRLAAGHSNEPAHIRAAVLRSLVKRANVWRLPADIWQHLLDFGHGLGLDGSAPEAACREGLHAVVIRQLLSGEVDPAVRAAFLNDFSTLTEYSLKRDERVHVAISLQSLLATAASEEEPDLAAQRIGQLLDVLETYHVCIAAVSSLREAVIQLALRDPEVARPVLERLYDAKIARRELLRVNLEFRRDQAALLNALRHDPATLEVNRVIEILSTGAVCCDSFISKLAIYFHRKDDFTTQIRTALKEKFIQEQNLKVARPLAIIMGNDFEEELGKLSASGTERAKAVALWIHAHRARPVINSAKLGWHKAGVKAVATRVMRSRKIERAQLTRTLAANRRTVRLALALSMRSEGDLLFETLASAVKLYSVVAIKFVLSYFHSVGATADLRIWDVVKPLLSNFYLTSPEKRRQLLEKTDGIPSTFKSDYCTTLYILFNRVSTLSSRYILRDLCALLPEVNDDAIEHILIGILEKTDGEQITYPAIFVRYLMLSRNENDFERRFVTIGNRFLERLDILRCEGDSRFFRRLDQVIDSLKYNAAFFDTKYTSCLTVIERILTWMHKFMPKEEYFKEYAQIHLTMLYYKAVRQSIKQMPDVFADTKRREREGVDVVGFFFGRYIAKEATELVCTYFDSLIELYTDALLNYLGDDYFLYGNSREQLIKGVLKGILAGEFVSHRMVIYVLKDYRCNVQDSAREEIRESMATEKEMQFFINAELYTQN